MRLVLPDLRIGMQRAILSRRFIISLSILLLLMYFSVWGFIATAQDAIYLLGLTLSGTANALLFLCLLPILPYATSFAGEWNEQAVSFWVIRLGCTRYALGKIVVSALSGFLFTAAGMLLFIGLLSLRLPLFVRSSTGDVYSVLLDQGHPWQYLFFYIMHLALSSALFAVAALWVSTIITHTFTAITGPLVIYFIAHRFTTTLDIPTFLKAGAIVERVHGTGTPWQALGVKGATVFVLVLIMGILTFVNIRRKVQHA
ncbi:MAG: hypothetical protein SCM11_03295 [Bacillota bacterium]|nr:hypothetical protein [Bacillota bacterium]